MYDKIVVGNNCSTLITINHSKISKNSLMLFEASNGSSTADKFDLFLICFDWQGFAVLL